MKSIAFLVAVCCVVSCVWGEEAEGFRFPRSSPESQGISSAAVLDFVDAADRETPEMHSFMLVRHGHVVAECWWAPYDANTRHALYSLSKSFTSTAAGFAITEGKFALDDPVVSFFPDDVPQQPGEHLRAMRVRHLLSMSTGHESEPRVAASDAPWTKTFLEHPVPHQPGTHFLYNTPATYMVSAIVQRQTGQTVLDYLKPRLFEPLGIDGPTWGTSPQGISLGGYGLSVRTEDIARLGQLYLQKGMWNGKQLLPASWVEAATSKQVANGDNPNSDWNQGYGFQFWRSRHNCFRGDGAFGQYCVVMPDQDAVVAITSAVKDMQSVLNLVWDKLLPAMQAEALPEAVDMQEQLRNKLASLVVPLPTGDASSPLANTVSGKRYRLSENDSGIELIGIESESEGDETTLLIRSDGKDRRVACGVDRWILGQLALGSTEEQPVAACGAWTSEDTYTAKICFRETPHCLTMDLKFEDAKLTLDSEMNVMFGPTKRPTLAGRVEP